MAYYRPPRDDYSDGTRPPLPQQTAPAPRPPMPPAQPAAPAASAYPTTGTGSDAAVAQANAAYNAGQRGSDPTKIPGFDAAALRNSAAGQSEDFDRFNDQVLAQWEQYRVPGPGKPQYRSMRGEPGLFDKPTECRPGWVPSGPNETDPCRPMSAAEGGEGGGAGGGAGAGAGGVGGDGSSEAAQIWAAIQARLQGGTRYTPEVMASLLGQVKNTAEAGAVNQRKEALAEAAARGMARAPETGAALRDIRSKTYGQTLQAKNALNMAKINADYEDKSQAIAQGLEWLNSLRSFVAAMAGTAAQKQAAMANITLGYARLNQEMDALRERHAQDLQRGALGF